MGQGDALRRNSRHLSFCCADAFVSLAEICWVMGNIVWMVEDVAMQRNFVPWCAAVSLFTLGALLMFAALLCRRRVSRQTLEDVELFSFSLAECEGQWSLAGNLFQRDQF